MTLRYLASFEGVHCSAQINDQFGAFIAHTQHIPERNIYAAVLTRAQWDKVRAERWANGGLISDGGNLVPDVDFVASDGKVFLDFIECQRHEFNVHLISIGHPLAPKIEKLLTEKKAPAEGLPATATGALIELAQTRDPASLENKILTAIGNTTMQIRLLASFLQVTEAEIRAEVDKSPLLRFSSTGKSVSKAA